MDSCKVLRTQIRELEDKCKCLEKSAFHLQIENIRLRQYATTLEQDLARALSTENKANHIPQFSKIWEEIITEGIVDAFSGLISRRRIVANAVQTMAIAVFETIKEKRIRIVSSISSILRIDTEKYILPLLQLNKDVLFPLTDENLNCIRESVKKILQREFLNSHKFMGEGADNLIRQMWRAATERIFEGGEDFFIAKREIANYNKRLHYCVDGFVKEGAKCVILLPGLIGTKAAVLPLDEEENLNIVKLETFASSSSLRDLYQTPRKGTSVESWYQAIPSCRKIVKSRSGVLGKCNGICISVNYYT